MKQFDPDRAYTTPLPLQTFFFYDLETSGLSPREDRIMQFAGQRTDLELNPIGDPVNLLIKLPDDTLPNPGAIMVTKITPQSTQLDGLGEAEFCQYLMQEIFTPGTCATGYNSVRFDDEFMRHLFWRNFHDPYEWQWKDGRSRWDLLDVVRLTRALRPEGINWPVTSEGVATNRLELITQLNGITHQHAHDALSDVEALISVTRLIKTKQPQLYQYLYDLRSKHQVQKLVNLHQKKPFVYASGRYSSQFNKTTVAFPLTSGRGGNLLVFDLRYNLEELLQNPDAEFFPIVKEFSPNKCPAVAPLGVLSSHDGWAKLQLSQAVVEQNLATLLRHPDFAERMREQVEQRPAWPAAIDPESALYGAFLSDSDRALCTSICIASFKKSANGFTSFSQLADLHPQFADERLPELLLHYKAKNFPTTLSQDEASAWETYRLARLSRQAPKFLEELSALQKLAAKQQPFSNGQPVDPFILEELTLWYQSLQPGDY
ncbi:MAG: exodeoxyribonuclease I [Candidatus Saccharibacteria bacterium]|nr:exodeoxyribonuclease I [Candidatus Saccharibacteria bacterium]